MRKEIILIFIGLLINYLNAQIDTTELEYVEFYYPSGQISSVGYFKDKKPEGYWKTFYENGILKSEGNRKNFLLDGEWKFYDEKGNLSLIINYKEGKKSGKRITYMPDSSYIVEDFENDVKEGFEIHYDANNKVRKIIPYKNNLQEGLGKEFDEDSNIITLFTYKKGYLIRKEKINRYNEKGQKHGIWKTFYDNDIVKTEAEYRNGILNGFYKEYDPKGNLLTIVKYVNGEPQYDAKEIIQYDIRYSYYPDGKIKIVGSYLNDLPHGIRREFSPDGKIEKGYIFKEGRLLSMGIIDEQGLKQGFWKEFYENGKLKEEGNYKNSLKIGEWKYYYPNQTLEQIGKFNNKGEQHGEWRWYYENGQLWKKEEFDNGKRVGLYIEYDSLGNEIVKGKYEDGEENGNWFYIINNIKEEGEYKYGVKVGKWKIKNIENDILLYEGNYVEGFPDGKHKYYWDNGIKRLEASYVMGIRHGEWFYYDQQGTLFLIVGYKNGIEVSYERVLIVPQVEEIGEQDK